MSTTQSPPDPVSTEIPPVLDSTEAKLDTETVPSKPTGLERIEQLERLIEAEKGVYACSGYIPKTNLDPNDLVIYCTHTGGVVDENGSLSLPTVPDQK